MTIKRIKRLKIVIMIILLILIARSAHNTLVVEVLRRLTFKDGVKELYMYVCVYVYIYIYIYIHTHTYIYIYIHNNKISYSEHCNVIVIRIRKIEELPSSKIAYLRRSRTSPHSNRSSTHSSTEDRIYEGIIRSSGCLLYHRDDSRGGARPPADSNYYY